MKKSSYILIGVAAFAGVLGALQVDRHFRGDQAPILVSRGSYTMPVVEEPGPLAAMPDFRAASRKVVPSVVSVDQFGQVRRGMYDESSTTMQTGTGSGVVVSSDGLIVTNNHVVVRNAQAAPTQQQVAERVQVRLDNGQTYTAKVLGRDPRSDLAVLKIDAKNLTPIEIGDSDAAEVGQWVIAVGNPLGFDKTVSVGVISSKGRSIDIANSFLINGIQTDAAINPGNSGGALTDSQGRLLGINSAIASRTGTSIGIGFAIPARHVQRVVDDIVKLGYVRYAGLGVSYNSQLATMLNFPEGRAELARQTGSEDVPSYGIIVGAVEPTSAAGQAGISAFDVLLEIDGQKLEDAVALNKILTDRKPGDTVRVRYWSKGSVKTANVKLQEIRSQ